MKAKMTVKGDTMTITPDYVAEFNRLNRLLVEIIMEIRNAPENGLESREVIKNIEEIIERGLK